ncbi:MAG TPA: MBL fold metallo-hydrolase [Blastocatellia bacterium]|nr:MBL fold metallo-hydrolase [Blastocatellia bacterium]
MALQNQRRAENVSGDFFVDHSCIDCDLCRQIAPDTFKRIGEQSAVHQQPATAEAQLAALKALITCPTSSIGDAGRHDVRQAVAAFPEPVEGDVYFCGFAAESSYGAAGYFIRRAGGNVLVDSPRFARPLARRIEELGGIKLILLTHRDDVADHERWAAHFNAERVLHRHDISRSTEHVERLITGSEVVQLADDLLVIPTPGHTRGHMIFLYKGRYLFTGDHLWWSPDHRSLYASPRVCWYDWGEQTRSMERLPDYDFEWVLPGHGRRYHAADAAQMREQLKECIRRMKSRSGPTRR